MFNPEKWTVAFEYAVLAAALSIATFLMSKQSWITRAVYFGVSVLFGTTTGYVVDSTEMISGFSHLAAAAASITAPATLAWLQGKTLKELVEEVQDILEDDNDAKKD